MKPTSALRRSTILAVLASAALAADAGGFYLYDANPAATFLPKTAWSNPAGMTGLDTMQVQGAAVVLAPTIEWESAVATGGGSDGGNAGDVVGIPDLSFVMPLGEKFRFGAALTGFFGGATDYGTDFVGRYAVTEVELGGAGLVGSFAYEVNDKLSVGAGLAVIQSTLDEKIAINNVALGAPPGSPDGRVHFDELDDTGLQPFGGITFRAGEKTVIGIVYRGEADIELEGQAHISDLRGLSRTIDSQIDWTNPQTFELGVQTQVGQKSYLILSGDWQDWSVFKDNLLTLDFDLLDPRSAALPRNWEDTYHFGATFARVNAKSIWAVGLTHDTSAVEDQDRTFDIPVDAMTKFSGTYLWNAKPNWKYFVGGSLIAFGDAPIDQTAQGVQVAGEFDKYSAFAVSGGVIWKR